MDFKILISIVALIISLISLGWNIYNKIKSEKKKLLIQSYKVKWDDTFQCVITLTNIGNKPVFVRRIELHEKLKGKSFKRHLDFNNYRKDFENIPINPEHWKTLTFKDSKHFGFYDSETKKFKKTKIKVIDPKGKIYSTKWFRQSNLR